ncbi:hypothetical protein EV426DRAFT_534238 [Tirmania nivea]|nr:hypothetical protein EV426DRAFT_534238 [Tirmania nivea]
MAQLSRSKTQQLVSLRRQFATFGKKDPLVPSSSRKPEEGMRLLERLKHRGRISDYDTPPALTNAQRLLPSFLFTLAICAASYAYTQYWQPPRLSNRLFPQVPQSVATVGAIITANFAIFLLWKIPVPLNWRILNKYFVSVPGLPSALALLGAAFSHQSFAHLGLNCFALYVFGTTLCDQIGRGNFLAVYFTSAVVSGFASLAYHVLRARFHVFALGASGAVSGVLGAYAYLNPNRELYSLLFPFVAVKAAHFVGAMAGWEVWGLLRGYTKVDHVAHLSGLASGLVCGLGLWHAARRRGERRIKRWWGERA